MLKEILLSHPTLKAGFSLKGNYAVLIGGDDFRLINGNDAYSISQCYFEFLHQCDGRNSLQQIIDKYSEPEKILLEKTILDGEFDRVIDWNESESAIGNFAIIPPSEHLVTPTALLFHLTNVCNFRCNHCYHNDYQEFADQLTLPEIKLLAKEVMLSNIDLVILSGGEPFLRKELGEIAKIFSDFGIRVQINTNGSIIDEKLLEKLINECQIKYFSVSIDGPNEVSHNEIRKNPKSWAQIQKFFSVLRSLNAPYRVSSTLNRKWLENIDSIESFMLMLNELGIGEWVITRALKTGEAYKNNFADNYGLSPEETIYLSKHILNLLQKHNPQNIGYAEISELFTWIPNNDANYPVVMREDTSYKSYDENNILCDVHRFLVQMEPNGDLPFCSIFKSRFPMIIGNTRKESFGAIWNKLCELRMTHTAKNRKHCSGCSVLKFCGGGCPGEDPDPNVNLLNSCDKSNYGLLPLIKGEFENVLNGKLKEPARL